MKAARIALIESQIDVAGVVGGVTSGGKRSSHSFLKEPRPDIVEKVRAWILKCCRFTTTIRNDRTCYSFWKVVAEQELGFYIANGEFVVAAIRAGARAVPEFKGAQDVVFNLSLNKRELKVFTL